MTLVPLAITTRLQLFFLVSLTIVLLAFSVGLYLAARADWLGELDERLKSAIVALSASVEMHDEGVEWEPQNRLLHFGVGPEAEQVRWVVYSDTGKQIDQSENMNSVVAWPVPLEGPDTAELGLITWHNETWQSARRVVANPVKHTIPQNSVPGRRRHEQYPAVQLTAAVPIAPVNQTLRSLAWFLAALSSAILAICAYVGKFVCRRALKPLVDMARDMERIPVDQPGRQLPVRQTHDELDNLAASFNDLLIRFQHAYGNQRRFAADASHQLRTPLAVIMGQVEVALRRDRSSEEYQRVLELIHRRIVELQHIMEALLLLARSQEDRQILESSAIDLREFVPEVLSHRAEFARSGDVRCQIDDDQLLIIKGHQRLLEQAIGNLLDNASRYSPPGTPIVVTVQRGAAGISIMVDDQGPGIADDDVPLVFEPFFSGNVKTGENVSGAGLGLAVAKRITEVFHGSIAVSKSPLGGARFVMSFPPFDASLQDH